MADKKVMSESKFKAVAAVLFSLTLLCAVIFVGRYFYLKYSFINSATAVVSQNLIGKAPESSKDDSVNVLGNKVEETQAVTETTAENVSENITDKAEVKAEANSQSTSESFVSEMQTSSGTDFTSNTPIGSDVKDNAPMLELYKKHPTDNEKFEVQNMLPGDEITKYFCVKISHKSDVTLGFNAEMTEETKRLSDVLFIKITHIENGNVLYNGTFADMNINGYSELFKADGNTESTAYYKITVTLPTSVKNEHQAAMLKADFNWYVADGEESLTTPKTGDSSNIIWYIVISACSLAFVLFLIFFRRRSKEDDEQLEA